MEKLRLRQEEELVAMVDEELKAANTKYPMFSSPMEGLGVLQEEVYESTKEWRAMLKDYEALQHYLCAHQSKAAVDCSRKVQVRALLLARELLQVAAMCRKFEDSEVVW